MQNRNRFINKKRISLFIQVGLVATIAIFLILYLQSIDYEKLSGIRIHYPFLLFSAFCSLAYRYWGAFIWRTMLHDLGSKSLPRFTNISAIYGRAWMARYIPGTVTWIAGKVYLARKIGISKSRLTVSTLLEAAIQVAAISVVSLLLIVYNGRIYDIMPAQTRGVVIVFVLLILIMLVPRVFNRIVGSLFRLIKKIEPSNELSVSTKAVVRSFVFYALGTFIAGSSFFFLCISIWPETDYSEYFYIVGAFNLAGVIGMVTPIVPSGMGVKDASLFILLALVFPQEIAITLAIASRIWAVVSDLLFFGITDLANRFY